MARFLFAWELGGGLGHARPLARLAAALLRRGHQVDLVWKDLSVAEPVLGELSTRPGLTLWQAPTWLPQLQGMPEPSSHAELLFRVGYLDAVGLAGPARAWRTLFDGRRPDLLVADHAPTALLAARGLPLRRAVFGNGFTVPPAASPWPSYREWEDAPTERLAAADARVHAVCNEVLWMLGEPPLASAAALYEADEVFMLGWPMLDHLLPLRGPGAGAAPADTLDAAPATATTTAGATTAPRSWGWPAAPDGGVAPVWPEGDGPRLFGYLQSQHPAAQAALDVLRAGPWRGLLHLGGVSAEDAERLSTPSLRVTTALVDIERALREASVLVGSASSGTLYAALAAGVPAVMLPMQAEQMLLARRVVGQGAGVLLWPTEVAAGLARAIDGVLTSRGFAKAAQALAARRPPPELPEVELAGFDPDPVTAGIAARCEALALTGSAR